MKGRFGDFVLYVMTLGGGGGLSVSRFVEIMCVCFCKKGLVTCVEMIDDREAT